MKYELYLFLDGTSYKAAAGKDGVTDDDMRVLKRVVKGSQKTEAKVNRLDTVSIEVITEDGWQDMDIGIIVEEQDEHEQLHIAIAALPTEEQSIIQAVYFQGLSVSEIARNKGVTEGTIRYRLKQIHNTLKILLK